MNIVRTQACLLGAWLMFAGQHGFAQTVAEVAQVLPFATTGTVTTASAAANVSDIPGSSSPGRAAIPGSQSKLTTAGGKIATGEEGAASLVLGAGADVGTARLGPESEVKVPDAGEKGHSLEMLKGQLFLNISADQLKQRGNSEFKLKTPAALLAVKGTKFFSRTENGMDTIGVHEGSVEVVEPGTGQKLTLAAGQAVEVSPGILSAMREMTDEEKLFTPEYDKANIAKMSCGNYNEAQRQYYYQGLKVNPEDLPPRMVLTPEKTFVQAPNGELSLENDPRPWLHWQEARVPGEAKSFFAPKPQLTEQGTVRYAWKARTAASSKNAEPMLISGTSNVAYLQEGNPESKLAWQKLVAVEFQLRAVRVDSIEMIMVMSNWGNYNRLNGEDRIRVAKIPPDGTWVNVTYALRSVPLPREKQYLSPAIQLEVVPQLPDKLSQNVTAVEMRNFVLLFQP